MKSRALLLIVFFSLACATSKTDDPRTEPRRVRHANAFTPVATPPVTVRAPLIRVGLLTDESTVAFPRIEGGYVVSTESGPSTIRRGFTLHAPLAGTAGRFGVQVATLSERASAEALQARLEREMSLQSVLLQDPTGRYRVIAGDFESAAAAEPVRGEIVQRGVARDAVVARRPTSAAFTRTLRLVDDEGDEQTLTTASVLVVPASSDEVRIGGQPYRGGARVFVNDRGLVNVINELNFEDYIRGVVPNEMGPSIYDEVEALKVQALAARTYAARHMGEFEREGYDICPTPACQAYKGKGTEHALSDRAVQETAGLIITHNGEPIDALYTSTCGGETSDADTMFPGRQEPYLQHTRCVELEMLTIAGRRDSGLLSEPQVEARLFEVLSGVQPDARGYAARDVVSAVQAAARFAGLFLPSTAAVPASIRRGDVLRYLGQSLRFSEFSEALLLPEDRRYFFPAGGADDPARIAAAFTIKYRIAPAQNIDRLELSQPMPREELYAFLGSWLRRMEALREVTGKVHAIEGRTITLKAEGKTTKYQLPAGLPLFRRLGERAQEYASLPVLIGDRVVLSSLRGGGIAALFLNGNYDGAAFDRTSNFSSWTRSYRADELVTSIAKRQPIKQLADIRPVRIDDANRIAELQVIAEDNRTITLRGLLVRWSLNLPDNLFVYTKTEDADGVDRYTFHGKGWGHGTGFCQVGAYGAAFRGWNAERIVKHYYRGVEISRMRK